MKQTYVELVIKEGRPTSFHELEKKLRTAGVEIDPHFSSLSTLEAEIFLDGFVKVRDQLLSDEVFAAYSAREKLLAIFYTWLEDLEAQKAFWRIVDQAAFLFECQAYMQQTKAPFQAFVKLIISQGLEEGSIARRPITDYYIGPIWCSSNYIFHSWLRDESKNSERSDAAVEKTVNFVFDLMEPGWLDSGFEWTKFLFQG